MVTASVESEPIKPPCNIDMTQLHPTTLSSTTPVTGSPTETNFQSLSKLNTHITELVQNNVFLAFLELLKMISLDYKDKGLTFDELKNRYLNHFKNSSSLFNELLSSNVDTMNIKQLKQEINRLENKNTSPIIINTPPISTIIESPVVADESAILEPEIDVTRCFARTYNKKVCSRKKQRDQEYCGGHAHNQPHGRIDHDLIYIPAPIEIIQGKKRGRPSKSTSPIIYPTENVVEMEASVETIGGIEYIIDQNQYIYKYPENINEEQTINLDQLKLLGQKLKDKKIIWYSETDLQSMAKSRLSTTN